MEHLPSEILNLIGQDLSFMDRYHFAKANKWIYDCIWKPLDTEQIYDRLMLLLLANLYFSILCENQKDVYLMLPFVIPTKEYINTIKIGLSFFDSRLYINFITYSSNDDHQIIDRITQFENSHLFERDQSTINHSSIKIKCSKIICESESCSVVEMIHYNIMNLILNFNMIYYVPMYNECYDVPESLFEIVFRNVDNISRIENLHTYLHSARNYDKDYYSYIYKSKSKTDCLSQQNVEMTHKLFQDLHSIFCKLTYTDKYRLVRHMISE